MKKTIIVVTGETLHTRQVASELIQLITTDPCAHIELDFSKVEYISRSFADQFHSEKLALATTSKKTVIVSNANEEVIQMLQTVARTQDKVKREGESIPVYNYTDWKNVERFLLSL
jgi:hypothetical protein